MSAWLTHTHPEGSSTTGAESTSTAVLVAATRLWRNDDGHVAFCFCRERLPRRGRSPRAPSSPAAVCSASPPAASPLCRRGLPEPLSHCAPVSNNSTAATSATDDEIEVFRYGQRHPPCAAPAPADDRWLPRFPSGSTTGFTSISPRRSYPFARAALALIVPLASGLCI